MTDERNTVAEPMPYDDLLTHCKLLEEALAKIAYLHRGVMGHSDSTFVAIAKQMGEIARAARGGPDQSVYVAIQMCETCGHKALAPAVCPDHPGTAHRSIPYIGMRQHQDHMAGKDEYIAAFRRDLEEKGVALTNKTFRLREARALLEDCREAMRGLPTLTTEQDDVRIRLATFLG